MIESLDQRGCPYMADSSAILDIKKAHILYVLSDCRQTRCWDHPSTIFSFKVKLYPKIS